MTTIDALGPVPPARPAARTAAAAVGGFAPRVESEPAADSASDVATPTPVALDSLLWLQQVDPPVERDHAARRHGQALVAALGRLQRALLSGSTDNVLEELRALAGGVPQAADPELAAAIDHVVLRARIELARRGVPPEVDPALQGFIAMP